MLKFRYFFIIGIFLVCSASIVLAQTQQEIFNLIVEYHKAVKSRDRGKIDDAWHKVNNSPQAIEYMKKNLPKHYQSFKLQGLRIESKVLQNTFGEPENYVSPDFAPGTAGRTKPMTISEQAKQSPAQNEPSNQEIVDSTRYLKLETNSEAVKSFPNQSRTSNQDDIRQRLREIQR